MEIYDSRNSIGLLANAKEFATMQESTIVEIL